MTLRTATYRDGTVGYLIELLKQFPPHFRLDFSPGECDDVTGRVAIEVLEGSTDDGPGRIWIRLMKDW